MDQTKNQPTENEQSQAPGDQAPNQPSAKERIELARGKNIPIDHFLYACLEHERTQRAQFGDDLPSGGRWPLMVGATSENPPGDFGTQTIKVLMNRICGWYAAQYPDIVEEIPLDHDVLNHVVAPFMNFTLDLVDLVLLKTSTSLPSHNADTEESKALWAEITLVLKESFPGYHGYFIRFLKWAFADIEPEEFEPGSRPPVGKNMPNFRAMANAQNHSAQQSQQDRSQRPQGGRPQSGRQHGGGQGGRPQGGGQGGGYRDNNRGGGGQGGRDQNRGGQQGDRGNGPNRQFQKPRHGGPQGGGQGQQADAETEKLALAAVDDAMNKIQTGGTDEVFLKPMNSFYRRIQHQYAVDKGFQSCSVGDGNERGVKVSKPIKN
ncbi:MAG: hypothetical protein NTV34_15395 [Proteobacteria bacterium]|nr:hypothetical protein [Pseudomonadota bacterium]